jgi:acetyl esterase/lipase
VNVTREMIDRELRAAGRVANLIVGSPSEARFRRSLRVIAKPMRSSNAKGLWCSEEWIPRAKDRSGLRVRIYGPLSPKEGVPGVLWMHGGGYAFGLPEMSTGAIRRLILESRCVVVAPDYRLSIERPYSAALEDRYEALLWMKSHAGELGIRDDQLMVGGESAGGGLACALTLYARDKGKVRIAFQIPLYPMIDGRMESESARENNAPVWSSRANTVAWKLDLGELYGKDVPAYAAAARATNHRGLPPTVTFVGHLEPFRDETIEYVDKLRKAGVPVDFPVFAGCYHSFETMSPNAEVSRRAVAFVMDSFRYAVGHYFAEQ